MKTVVLKSASRVSQTLEEAVISCKFALCFVVAKDDDFLTTFPNFSDSAKEISLLISNYSSLESEFMLKLSSHTVNKFSEKRDSINQRAKIQDAFIHLNERILGCPNELNYIMQYFANNEKVRKLLSSHERKFSLICLTSFLCTSQSYT